MADSFYKLEDETFPSFLGKSLENASGRPTLGNVTLGSGPGLPVAASTVAKIRPEADNREDHTEVSYLDSKELQKTNLLSSAGEHPKFALSFKDDLDNADDFIAAHRLSNVLVNISLDESASRNPGSMLGPLPIQTFSEYGRPTELGTDLSTGLLTFAQCGQKQSGDTKTLPVTAEDDHELSEGVDSDHFNGSNSSFLANEKLMSVESMDSDVTDDDDIDLNNLPDDELDVYFNKLVPHTMQRGRVEGQEIPATRMKGAADDRSDTSSTEDDDYRHQILDRYDKENFQMPDVRLAATGMDSCPASDEDTDDELESARRNNAPRTELLPSTSRQLVGESNHPSFRPGLEGGSSDEEDSTGCRGLSQAGIEHRRSAEGQVINLPVTGDGGGGDGSSGSEESGNDGGVATVPIPLMNVQTSYDALRGLGIVGGNLANESNILSDMPEDIRNSFPRHSQMGDRVGPVGTGEASSSAETIGASQRLSVNWSMMLDRQEALNAMENTESGPVGDRFFDSVYLRNGAGERRSPDSANISYSQLQSTQGSFHLSQMLPPNCEERDDDEGIDEPDGRGPSLGIRGGPCGDVSAAEASDGTSEDDRKPLSTSLEPKYFSQSFHQEQEDSEEDWNHCPDDLELEFQQNPNATHNIVYQNEEGQWVTDLAYYSCFEKEVDGKTTETAGQFQTEDFVPANNAMEKILKDQEEFEKQHRFMQEEQIEPASSCTFHSDSSWKIPTNSQVLMRTSQVSSEFKQADESYLRLSLGQFFGQRSEALGCLGSTHAVKVKRPSFGYVITSPEKREPFPLIHPSELGKENASSHNETTDLSEAEKTLNPEDLEKTINGQSEMMQPKMDKDPGACKPEDCSTRAVHYEHSQGLGPESSQEDQSCVSPDNNSSQLMLSISAIASAITNASISTDPSQLAAMIMDLSKKSRARSHPDSSGRNTEEAAAARTVPGPDPSAIIDNLQKSICAGEISAFDIEKYLKKANLSGSSNSSVAHTTFDLSDYAESVSSSERNPQKGYPIKQGIENQPMCTKTEEDTRMESMTRGKSKSPTVADVLSSPKSECFKTSSIPRPRVSVGTAQRPVNSGQVSPRKSSRSTCEVATETSNIKTLETSYTNDKSLQRTFPNRENGESGLPCLKGPSPSTQRNRSVGQQPKQKLNYSPEKKLPVNISSQSLPHGSVEKQGGLPYQNTQPAQDTASELPKGFSGPCVEDSNYNFRPSTSPLTHSSPSQTSLQNDECMVSPSSSTAADRCPAVDLSPQSTCSSPSLSRLTYISINDGTVVPTPERKKRNSTMALSTTIIRFSPTPPVETDVQSNQDGLPKKLDGNVPQHAKSLDTLSTQQCKSPERLHPGSTLDCARSQSECHHHCSGDLSKGCRNQKHLSEASGRQLTKVDSGYCSNLNIQQTNSSAAPQGSQQWRGATSVLPSAYPCGLGMPPVYSAEGLQYVPVSGFKPQCPGMVDLSSKADSRPGNSHWNSQLPHLYLAPEAPLHPGAFNVGPTGNGLYSVLSSGGPKSDLAVRHIHSTPGITGFSGTAEPHHHLPRPNQNQQEMRMMGKAFNQYGGEPLVTGDLQELGGQVVVPEELRFPHACCVGIASQTSLSLYNPSERWQQVSITVTSVAIDGERVEIMPYQWIMVKNKTIIGPKSTEEQKVLFLPPKAGVYHCILSVCSWPASAETELAARANVFARTVVLVAIAENPTLEIESSKSGCVDFGDLPEGSVRSLPLRLLNRTHATVPIRLVISANATAWRCFSFSKHPVTVTSEGTQQDGHMTPLSSPSVINHVMQASHGENPENFTIWVHFKAPQKYTAPSGDLGPPDEYSARVDVELDSPGPSHIIRSIPLKARSGIARVHAPKDLQSLSLHAPVGKCCQQTLPLKNAGNIDVQLKLKSNDDGDSFSVKPDELFLRVEEEQNIVVSFKTHNKRCRQSVLTILVLPSGPQYEVTLRGEVIDSGKPGPVSNPICGPSLTGDVPPILSNKQFVAWGGVTLGRAVQQKLVLRNNSASTAQHLRLLIRGQDQDCFQLQSMFSLEERLTRHGELSIRPREDVMVHLLFAPTRVACMLAKLEIKQCGVRPSQPGVKFTIPLSGYGGTSNIILEDQRKRAEGYVASLTDIVAGRVSKVCLCVRNTGSRAAFIKAVVFSDVPSRSVIDPSVMSLAPSQFVLKERTQEVITVLMKSTQRELNLCSANTPLATICLFCGDEVSRQQYRRLLETKPEAARKALSENSLLKNIEFNEMFLGEDTIKETYDLPHRPNEAHIFYSNMSRVVISLLGTAKTTVLDEDEHTKVTLSSNMPSSRSERVSLNGSTSLDVLPVKDPQGSALRVTNFSPEASEHPHTNSESWTIHPTQLVLGAPTINGPSSTSHVEIRNISNRQLTFDLSWPAHCLTVTPQHGLIEPQCHLLILVSPNPSLANKSALLPWTGQIYAQCDGQQKFIKVQVRQDLALDISATPADATLSALAAQAPTPVQAVTRPGTKPMIEMNNKAIIFPSTRAGETSEAQIEVQNGKVEVRWYLSSFAPPYVKGVDETEDVYRATYTAFRCSKVSGTLGAHEKMQVPVTFMPRDRGDYVQFWDLECHPVTEPQQKTRIRFQLCGSGTKSGSFEGPQNGDCSLVKTEATVKSRKRPDATASKTSQEEAVQRGVYSPHDLYSFPDTQVGELSSLKVNIRNNSSDTHELTFVKPREPFSIKHSKYSLRSQHYLKLPVKFKPSTAGRHTGLLLIQSETSGSIVIQLTGDALP